MINKLKKIFTKNNKNKGYKPYSVVLSKNEVDKFINNLLIDNKKKRYK